MVVADSQESSVASNSKVGDAKPNEWCTYSLWYGPCRRLPYEFAEARKEYPKIPAERAEMFEGDGLTAKLSRALTIGTCAMRVRTDFKGREVVKRTILVTGGNVKKLEAAAEKINKQQQ